MEIHVAQSDITSFPVDAIIVPCHASGINEGFRTVIQDKGAEQIEAALKEKAPLAVGAAMLAQCPLLGAKNAILIPIMKYKDDDVATELLRRAIKAALIASNMKRYQTIALPPMMRLEGGPTIAEATRAVVQEINTHKLPFPEKIYLVDEEEAIIRIFEDTVLHAQHSL